jgi:hypothetical protein
MKIELSRRIFEKRSNITFHENPFSECQTEGQTDMTKLLVTFVLVRKCLKEQSVNKCCPVSTKHSTHPILRVQKFSS